jgi:hypothetical protein
MQDADLLQQAQHIPNIPPFHDLSMCSPISGLTNGCKRYYGVRTPPGRFTTRAAQRRGCDEIRFDLCNRCTHDVPGCGNGCVAAAQRRLCPLGICKLPTLDPAVHHGWCCVQAYAVRCPSRHSNRSVFQHLHHTGSAKLRRQRQRHNERKKCRYCPVGHKPQSQGRRVRRRFNFTYSVDSDGGVTTQLVPETFKGTTVDINGNPTAET